MTDYTKLVKTLRYTAKAMSAGKIEVLRASVLIDAAAAIEALEARLGEAENSVERWKDMYLTKHEPKRGKWYTELYDGEKKYQCSNCLTHWDVETRYCPFCGAKMEVQE